MESKKYGIISAWFLYRLWLKNQKAWNFYNDINYCYSDINYCYSDVNYYYNDITYYYIDITYYFWLSIFSNLRATL